MRSEESKGRWFTNMGALYALAAGGLEAPEELRRHPEYRAFFAASSFGEIARARIANGHPEGLPLNDDGSLVEY